MSFLPEMNSSDVLGGQVHMGSEVTEGLGFSKL